MSNAWALGHSRCLKTHEWKSATVAFSPAGNGMNSWLAPLMTVRGTRPPDTVSRLVSAFEEAEVKLHRKSKLTDCDIVGQSRILNSVRNKEKTQGSHALFKYHGSIMADTTTTKRFGGATVPMRLRLPRRHSSRA
jgi:hypothetical protein